jgi:hypothetical protein
MSELDDIVAVFGRIDDAVVENPELLPEVAAMLPPYRHPGVSGWYQAVQTWQAAQDEVRLIADRTFGGALTNLQDETAAFAPEEDDNYEAWATRDWLNSRRILAGVTMGRIHRHLDRPDRTDFHRGEVAVTDDSTGQVIEQVDAWLVVS